MLETTAMVGRVSRVTPTSRAKDHLDPPLVVVAETEPEPAGLSDGAASSPLEGEG